MIYQKKHKLNDLPFSAGDTTWSGETTFVVTESFGTKLINGIINLGRIFFNNFRSEKNQKDFYGYYTKAEVEALKDKPSDNVSAWIKTENVPKGYFEQIKGCTK